nr:MAG TPA: hypothetical protein [Caudoviricetes sp.]
MCGKNLHNQGNYFYYYIVIGSYISRTLFDLSFSISL